ncbi:hypothetical protein [Taibaiella koreensis]|uniref:hypothetical protein n=1 Tax=Taibaiella koreensis TaxID=1268548 RepID=UPI000E59E522|nr:hypothetical protein [Taibaiella koreensis]
MKLTKDNIEEYLLLLVDEELDPAAMAEVERFLSQHGEYRPVLEAYRATKLDSEEMCFFPGKESLLRPEPAAVPLKAGKSFRLWRQAAALALLLGLGLAFALLVRRSGDTGLPSPVQKVAVADPDKDPGLPKDTTERKIAPQPSQAIAQQPSVTRQPAVRVIPQRHSYQIPDRAQSRKQEAIASLATATSPAMLPEAPLQVGQAINREWASTPLEEKKALPGWLPVKEESVEGVGELVAQAQELRDNIAEKAKMLKKASFVIRIGDKDVIALGR